MMHLGLIDTCRDSLVQRSTNPKLYSVPCSFFFLEVIISILLQEACSDDTPPDATKYADALARDGRPWI